MRDQEKESNDQSATSKLKHIWRSRKVSNITKSGSVRRLVFSIYYMAQNYERSGRQNEKEGGFEMSRMPLEG